MTNTPTHSLSRDIRTLIFLLVGVVVAATLGVLLSPAPQKSLLSTRSDQPEGALALRWWLESTGYTVEDAVIPGGLDNVDALFVLEPERSYTADTSAAIRAWVGRGNTLIVAGSTSAVSDLLNAFYVNVDYFPSTSVQPISGAPTLIMPVVDALPPMVSYGITTERDDVVPHLFRGATPVLVSLPQERGVVWVSGMTYPFTNRGIQEEQNARLIANLLASVPSGGRIAFDESLRAFGDTNTFNDWLFGTAPGWGVVLGVVITFVFLAARGRRFGSPIPLAEEKLRREPIEYIRAIATLYRRAGGRDDVLKHYRDQFRRQLSMHYRIDPRLDDAEMVRVIVYRDPTVDEAELRLLLQRLARSHVNEHDLLQTVHDMDAWLKLMR